MKKRGWMVLSAGGLLLAVMSASCEPDEVVWESRDSYVMATDTTSVIYVLDDTGKVLLGINPLSGKMKGIWQPTFVEGSKKIAFLSRPDSFSSPALWVTDRSGADLTLYEIAPPSSMDGSPVNPELVFTAKYRLSMLDAETEEVSILFSDTEAESEVVGTVSFTRAMVPCYSPSGEEIAFVNLGKYLQQQGNQQIEVPRADIGVVSRDGSGYRLLTGGLNDPLPTSGDWAGLCFSHDGEWVFAVKKDTASNISTIYGISFDDETTKPSVYIFSQDWFKYYDYVVSSPAGDSLIFGSDSPHADLYVVEYKVEGGELRVGAAVSGRLTTAEVFAQPDWAPGTE